MFKYANEPLSHEICAYLNTFQEPKSELWIKPGSKLLFHFVVILVSKAFTEGYLFVSLHKSENTVNRPKISIFIMFLGMKCYIIQAI